MFRFRLGLVDWVRHLDGFSLRVHLLAFPRDLCRDWVWFQDEVVVSILSSSLAGRWPVINLYVVEAGLRVSARKSCGSFMAFSLLEVKVFSLNLVLLEVITSLEMSFWCGCLVMFHFVHAIFLCWCCCRLSLL